MIIQIILLTVFAALLLRIVTQRTISKFLRAACSVIVLLACYVVAFPSVTNAIAAVVGVGRGADLILYLSMASVTFLIASLYIRSKKDEIRTAKLVQQLALQNHRVQQLEGRIQG
jgi:small membrane protein